MSEINQTEVVEEITTTGTELTADAGQKTFTQAELDEVIQRRLGRLKKDMPEKSELEAFKQWKESQKTEAERQAQREQEYHKLESERDTIKREITVLKAGVLAEYIDFINFTVSKVEGDFNENLTQFLKDNPKYLKQTEAEETKATGVTSRHQSMKGEELGFLKHLENKNPNFNLKGVG